MNYKDKEYHRQKSKEHYQKYKKQYDERNAAQRARTRLIINESKLGGCVVCGEKELACLDHHHVDGKDMEVSSMLARNENLVKAEIAKCVVLCANCHRKHHAGVLNLPQ